MPAAAHSAGEALRSKRRPWQYRKFERKDRKVAEDINQHVDKHLRISEPHPHSEDTQATTLSMTLVDEDSPWTSYSILCLDGGGVRGLSSLIILRNLMQEIAALEKPEAKSSAHTPLSESSLYEISFKSTRNESKTSRYLPCHYFDFIAGTSTGGLIAIMLGRLRMSIDEAVEKYIRLCAEVFEKPSSKLKRSLTKYNYTVRMDSLKRHFYNDMQPARSSPEERNDQFTSDPERCRTIVCSMKSDHDKGFQTPFLFRSYFHPATSSALTTPQERLLERNPGYPSIDHSFAIWEVAKATSAAPSYFKPMVLSDMRYYDAAVDVNNPSLEVIQEINFLGRESHAKIGMLLSIGGGSAKGNNPKSRFGGESLLQSLTKISTMVEREVKAASEHEGFQYYRLDVKEGLSNVGINQWKPRSTGKDTLEQIEKATERCCHQHSIRHQLVECAEELVRKRKLRSRTMNWECFATGTRYKCTIEGCPDSDKRFQTRNALMDHLRDDIPGHNKPPPDANNYKEIQCLLDKGRTQSG